jgi:hypothetical protein
MRLKRDVHRCALARLTCGDDGRDLGVEAGPGLRHAFANDAPCAHYDGANRRARRHSAGGLSRKLEGALHVRSGCRRALARCHQKITQQANYQIRTSPSP